MANGVNMAIAISTTIRMIAARFNVSKILLVVCTNSFSLYKCLVKLGITKEKRLIIDIMALHQAYERQKIQDIRWINDDNNPANAITKAKPNRALEQLVTDNKITIKLQGWMDRTSEE
jgi:hypothetical protein